MSKRKVETGPGIVRHVETVNAKTGKATRHTMDDHVATHRIEVEVREYDFPTIAAGLRQEWGTVDVDGDELRICVGAGWGSPWMTIDFRGKDYAISAAQLAEAFLAVVNGEESDERGT